MWHAPRRNLVGHGRGRARAGPGLNLARPLASRKLPRPQASCTAHDAPTRTQAISWTNCQAAFPRFARAAARREFRGGSAPLPRRARRRRAPADARPACALALAGGRAQFPGARRARRAWRRGGSQHSGRRAASLVEKRRLAMQAVRCDRLQSRATCVEGGPPPLCRRPHPRLSPEPRERAKRKLALPYIPPELCGRAAGRARGRAGLPGANRFPVPSEPQRGSSTLSEFPSW